MDVLILKTNINSSNDFSRVKGLLKESFKLNECTVDLSDIDKVLRIIGEKLNLDEVISKVKTLGYYCEDLDY